MDKNSDKADVVMSHNIAQRLALNIDSHIVVDAGAGTGKTRTIIDRVIEHYLSADQRATRILPKPDRPPKLESGLISTELKNRIDLESHKGLLPSEVVLLTFTTKAADEIRDRLRKKLVNLSLGSKYDDGENMSDPRILRAGLSEQFLYLLDDAPIGTIDSFFHQLIAPYRGLLGNSLNYEQMTGSERIILKDSALNTLWRLPSFPLSAAVDAGIHPDDVENLILSRDRIQQFYSSRRRAMSVIRSLSEKSLFLDEAAENLTEDGSKISPTKLEERLLDSVDDKILDQFNQKIKKLIEDYCESIKQNITLYGGGWDPDTRISCLDYLSQNLPDTDVWDKEVNVENFHGIFNEDRQGNVNYRINDETVYGFDAVTFTKSSYGPERPEELIVIQPFETLVMNILTSNVSHGNVAIGTTSSKPVQHTMFMDLFGRTDFYRSSTTGVTTTSANVNSWENTISVTDVSDLPVANESNKGVIWINSERIEYTGVDSVSNKFCLLYTSDAADE